MTRAIVLDTGPLGRIAHPRPNRDVAGWFERHLRRGAVFVIPEIADYELRREFLRAGLQVSLTMLDSLGGALLYLPLSTATMRRAAELWARMRTAHMPTAGEAALDADVILAAQAEALAGDYSDVVVATENVEHLDRMVPARKWSDI